MLIATLGESFTFTIDMPGAIGMSRSSPIVGAPIWAEFWRSPIDSVEAEVAESWTSLIERPERWAWAGEMASASDVAAEAR